MNKVRNILFIMFDQLRWDYLGCAGHPSLHTPNIDWLASRGVRFSRAYVQSPVCGPSRMSTYTGRYCHSHGAQWNGYPLPVGEQTIGDHLRRLGMESWLLGKTHMAADVEGMERLGIAPDSTIGTRLTECGFDLWVRDDGLWSEGPDGYFDPRRSPYNEYLKARGYRADNPWNENANAGVTEAGEIASGWLMKFADRPANIREEDSETPWLTTRAIEFIDSRDRTPWFAHLSYIKPHWPYIVPAPYHAMFGPADVLPANRCEEERRDAHPILRELQNSRVGQAFQSDQVRDVVIPAYMGLIKQCDDQMGRLFDHLRRTGRMDDTLVVVTSDHGDYLGDHWLGDKDFFHEAAVRVPLIIYDPSPEADATRGTVCGDLVETIDLAATFIAAAGGGVPHHIVEGRSLLPLLHGEEPEDWRRFVVSEYDYSVTPVARNLGLKPKEARLFMIADERWKLIHSEGPGHRPILFDRLEDPRERIDLGGDAEHRATIDRMYAHLGAWARRMSQRTTRSDDDLDRMRGRASRRGIMLGLVDGSEVPEELTVKLRGRPADIIGAAADGPGAAK